MFYKWTTCFHHTSCYFSTLCLALFCFLCLKCPLFLHLWHSDFEQRLWDDIELGLDLGHFCVLCDVVKSLAWCSKNDDYLTCPSRSNSREIIHAPVIWLFLLAPNSLFYGWLCDAGPGHCFACRLPGRLFL